MKLPLSGKQQAYYEFVCMTSSHQKYKLMNGTELNKV